MGAKDFEVCAGNSRDVHAGVGLVTDTLGITKNAEVAEVSESAGGFVIHSGQAGFDG